jgi:2-iminobutanoate/2-iminopropanoate deaminase
MAKTVVETSELMDPIAHFSHGTRIGDEIHIGGTAGTDRTRRFAGTSPGLADMAAQTHQMFENIKTGLALLGGSLSDVVRVKGYIPDWRDFKVYNDVYVEHVKQPYPSRATVGTWGFPLPQLLIEAELIAVVGGGNQYLSSEKIPPALAPYAQAGVKARNSHHYCAIVPADLSGKLVGGLNCRKQTEQALKNLADTVAVAGLTLRDVVMLNVTLADMRDYASFEEVFATVFKPPYPARSVVGAPLGLPDLLVEIECIAVVGGGQPIDGLGWPARMGAASPAMRAGEHLYISGQPGIAQDGSIPPSAEEQTRIAWARIQAVLEETGMSLADVVRTNNILTDWRLFPSYNAGYGPHVSAPFPPRATVQAGLIDPRSWVQVEAIAHRQGRNAKVIRVVPTAGARQP